MPKLPLVVLALLASGCAQSLTQVAPTEVSTHFLFFKREGETVLGGVGDIYVEVGPNPGRRAPVRFAETVSGGTGNAWRATLWMALLSASEVLDIDPSSLRVTVEADGAVDGPSAGALLTAVIIAAVRRDAVLPNAILTGIINPDHTVGPVGGVPEKVEAALNRGMVRIGVPVGQALATSLATHKPVDVMERLKQRGAAGFVVRDVADAYEVLTGHRLDAPPEATPDEMALPGWANDALLKHARELVHQVDTAQRELKSLFDSLPADWKAERAFRDRVLGEAAEVHRRIDAGEGVWALYSAAEVLGLHMHTTTRLLTDLGGRLRKWDYVRKLLRSLHGTVAMLLDATVPEWKAWTPHDAIEVPWTVDTFEAFIHALRAFYDAEEALKRSPTLSRLMNDEAFVPSTPQAMNEVLEAVGPFVAALVGAQQDLLLGKAYLEVGAGWVAEGHRRRVDPLPSDVLKSLAGQYERVADANLEYVDTLLVQEEANQRGENPDTTRRRLLDEDGEYRQALMNRRLPSILDEKVLSGDEHLLADLSGAVSSYFASVTVVSKRYSLGAAFDAQQVVTAVRHEAALQSMLSLADRQARQTAARCRRVLGEVPISTLIEYDLGRRFVAEGALGPQPSADERARSVRSRLEGLAHFWRASTLGRLAVVAHRRMEARVETERGTDGR